MRTNSLVPFLILVSLAACKKTVSRQDLSNGGTGVGAANVGGTSSYVQAPVQCAINTPIPSYWLKSGNLAFTFECQHASNLTLQSVDCQLNNGEWKPCATQTTHQYSGLAQGTYSFRVRGTDSSGATGLSSQAQWGVDLTPPTVDSVSGTATDTSATLTFAGTKSGGGSTFKGYRCKLAPGAASWLECTPPVAYPNLMPSTDYVFSVKAYDGAGNESAASTFNFRTLAPIEGCRFTSAPAAYTKTRTQSISFKCTSATLTLTGAECRLDAGAWQSCPVTGAYQLVNLTDGPHSFDVRYIAQGGARGSTASAPWTVLAQPPVVQITAANVATLAASFTFSGRDAALNPLADLQCRLEREGAIVLDWAACSSPRTFSSGITPLKAHRFSVKGRDLAGNDSVPAVFNWTAPAAQAPSCNLLTVFATGARNHSSESFSFNCTAAARVTAVECRLDDNAWAVCDSPTAHLVSGLAPNTTHSFRVRATDEFGNVGSPTAPLTWFADNTKPTVTIDYLSTDASSARLGFTARDNDPTHSVRALCQLDGVQAWAPCTSPVGFNGLTRNASYTARIKAVDAAGNESPEATRTWTLTGNYTAAQCSLSLASNVTLTSGWTNLSRLTFQNSCVGGSAPASLACRLDNGAWMNCNFPYSVDATAPGTHTVNVRPSDVNGVEGPIDTFTWKFDHQGPVAQVTGHTFNDTGVVFTFEANDEAGGSGVAAVECRSGSGDWAACTSPQSYPAANFTAGQAYVFSVRARDTAGNVGAVSDHNWTMVGQASNQGWGLWSSCLNQCASGNRTRNCAQPSTDFWGSTCASGQTQTQACAQVACCQVPPTPAVTSFDTTVESINKKARTYTYSLNGGTITKIVILKRNSDKGCDVGDEIRIAGANSIYVWDGCRASIRVTVQPATPTPPVCSATPTQD